MREIKYRAWDKATKQWRYGSTNPYYGDRPFTVMSLEAFWRWVNLPDIMAYESVGEYTGLHDKNGKEIYEGDLLLYPNGEVRRVIWRGNPASFSPKEIDILHAPAIIGNLYENPELLKLEAKP